MRGEIERGNRKAMKSYERENKKGQKERKTLIEGKWLQKRWREKKGNKQKEKRERRMGNRSFRREKERGKERGDTDGRVWLYKRLRKEERDQREGKESTEERVGNKK